jgi:hypothetical protein
LRYLLLIGFALLGVQAAQAADVDAPAAAPPAVQPVPSGPGRITIISENDAYYFPNPTDQWYTGGTEFRYLSPPIGLAAGAPLAPNFLGQGAIRQQRYELLFGQEIFTPVNLALNPPDATDRPYAAWLYAGAGLYQQYANRSLDHFEVQVGVVGPAALGEQVQNGVHSILTSLGLSQHQAMGWDYQLKNEPGFVVSYDHKWRFGMPVGAGLSVDAIPEVGATVGNVYTYAETGTLLRFGRNLNADYGPAHMQPSLSGGSWFDPSELNGAFGWYVFAGGQVRAVARNIFLDGNSFVQSPSVEKYPIVADLSSGVSLFWGDIAKVDFVLIWRSKEFVGQSAPDRYGGINISFRTP